MNTLIIGNVIGLIAALMMVLAGFLKNKKEILIVQITQIFLAVISNLFLEAYSGAVVNLLCCIMNILCYQEKLTGLAKILLSIANVGLTLTFNNMGVIGLLPMVSTIIYMWLMSTKDVIKFKWLIIFNTIMWMIFDFSAKSYTATLFDGINIWANFITLVSMIKAKKNKVDVKQEEVK